MLYISYNKNLISRARKLRKNATPEENKLWYQYLSKQTNRCLRQKILGNYIVDFYCPKKKIAIELDGSQHYTEHGINYDNKRTKVLKNNNVQVIRITNNEIKNNFEGVCEYLNLLLE